MYIPGWHIPDNFIRHKTGTSATFNKTIQHYVRKRNVQHDISHIVENSLETLSTIQKHDN